MQKITAHWLKGLKPSHKQTKHRTDNLQVIVNPSGKVSLSFYYRAGDKQKNIKLGSYKGIPSKEFISEVQSKYAELYNRLLKLTATNAVVFDHELERNFVGANAMEVIDQNMEVDKGDTGGDPNEDFGPLPADYVASEMEKARASSFRQAAEEYMEWFESERKLTVDGERYKLAFLVNGYGRAKGLGRMNPNDIEGYHIQAILDALKKDHSHNPSHVKGVATRVWLWMKRRNWVKSKEAASDLDAPTPPPRDRRFSEDEIRRLLKGCSNHYRAIALNPLRIAEHVRVSWDVVDEDMNANILVKGGRYHLQPLTEDYIACADNPKEKGGHFFLNAHGNKLSSWSLGAVGTARAKEAGVTNHHSHDWRQTFGVWAERQKIQFEFWDSALSHQQQKGIRKVYGGYQYLEDRRMVLEQWNDYLREFWK